MPPLESLRELAVPDQDATLCGNQPLHELATDKIMEKVSNVPACKRTHASSWRMSGPENSESFSDTRG